MIPFQFPVQWREPFSATLTFATSIVRSQNGTEQRRADRYRPRVSFDFSVVLFSGELARFAGVMSSALRSYVTVGDPRTHVRLAEPAAQGAAQITVEEVPEWLTEGSYFGITRGYRATIHQVVDIEANVIALAEPLANPWSAGAKVTPALAGVLEPGMTVDLRTRQAGQARVNFQGLPNSVSADPDPINARNYVGGREVLVVKTNWSQGQSVAFEQDRQLLDYGTGAVYLATPVSYLSVIYSNDVYMKGTSAIRYLDNFFQRQKGRRGEFFIKPSVDSGRVLAADYEGGSDIIVAGSDTYTLFVNDSTYRWVGLRGQFYREIVSVDIVEGNTRMVLATEIPETISAGEAIEYLALARFESDEITFDWITDQYARSRVVVRTLPYNDPEEQEDTMDEGLRWLLDYYGGGFVEDVIFGSVDRVLNVLEPRFALIVDDATTYLIDTYGRDPTNRWLLRGTNRVLNVIEPNFAEA